MSNGQARVLGLLIFLALLELAIHPAVRAFFKIAYTNVSSNTINKASS